MVDTNIGNDETIENEHNENVVINIPFDPTKIKVITQPYTLGEIIDSLEHGEIKLDTEFQRRPDLWDNVKKSRFIESILLRLPIPTFYFDGQDDNLWRVVDGLQRISTLRHFVLNKKNPLKLEQLEFLKEFNGLVFEQLPRELQRRIRTFPITIYIIDKGTPEEVKYTIFSRINQGGLVLTPQEIRHALHQGEPSNLVSDLVRGRAEMDENGKVVKDVTPEGNAFCRVTEWKIRSERMEDRDFATRFVSFYLIPYQNYEPDLDSFMNKGMAEIKNISVEERQRLKDDFKRAMDLAWIVFGNDAFRKRFYKSDNRKPINKALFDTISVNFAKLNAQDYVSLVAKKQKFRDLLITLHNEPNERFLRSISQGTALKDNVVIRFEAVQDIINKTLNDTENTN